ncbi:MAG TPA: hypothetical protein VKU19_16440 [Bryobacteraceae bacterium]|nr:hypothetical protein [Bryobacteraceae bacterium]
MNFDIIRLAMCGHEIGHMSMVYWRAESLYSCKAVVNDDGSGQVSRSTGSKAITELMVKIAGPLVEHLFYGSTPDRAIRFASEYKDPQSDSSVIREMVRGFCNGVDSRKFQFQVQEQTRSVIQQPAMWLAIKEAAEKLYQAGSITGEEVEAILGNHGAPTMFNSPAMLEWVKSLGTLPRLCDHSACSIDTTSQQPDAGLLQAHESVAE